MDDKFLALIKAKLAKTAKYVDPDYALAEAMDENFLAELVAAGEYYMAAEYAEKGGNRQEAALYADKAWADYKAKYSNLSLGTYSPYLLNEKAMEGMNAEQRTEVADKLWHLSHLVSRDEDFVRRLSREMKNWEPPMGSRQDTSSPFNELQEKRRQNRPELYPRPR